MAVLISDSFNRANNTTTLGTTDSYNGGTPATWQYRSGSVFGISNNTAVTESGTNPVITYVDAGQSDVKVSITSVFSNIDDYFMLMFRYNASNNSGLLLGGNPIKIQSFSGSSYTNVGSPSSTLYNAAGDVFRVEAQGSNINVYRNGMLIITCSSTINQTSTLHGLIDWRSSSNGWDNFQVEDFNTGQTTTYVGGGSITASSSLTSASHVILAEGKAISGNTSLTVSEIFSYASNGTLNGQSSLNSNEDMVYLASGTLQSVSSLWSGDSYIGASGTRFSGNGSILSLSSLSSGEIEKYSGLGSISSLASLIGNAGLVIEEKGNIQAVSIPGNSRVNTIFHAHGDILTNTSLLSGDLLNGVRGSEQFEDTGFLLMHIGLLSHENLIHLYIPHFPVGEIYLIGIQKNTISLQGKQKNTISLNGVMK